MQRMEKIHTYNNTRANQEIYNRGIEAQQSSLRKRQNSGRDDDAAAAVAAKRVKRGSQVSASTAQIVQQKYGARRLLNVEAACAAEHGARA